MTPEVATAIARLRERTAEARRAGKTVGCVPTMGALHAGHGALIDCARAGTGFVVVTVFVNPLQFDRRDDYDAYARVLESDVAFCGERGVDVVFAPPVEEMYPQPSATFVDVPPLAECLCGKFRTGHFRGVATVVAKLFHIVEPDFAYFGEKDAQQLAIVERMVRDLNFPLTIVPVPTVREPDGLALSSRNRRLTPEERRIAPVLYRALRQARATLTDGPGAARQAALDVLAGEPSARVEYLEVVDAGSMHPVDRIQGPVKIAAAVWLGNTRLIDNV
jgi:pantoate--beta-alanine ligase